MIFKSFYFWLAIGGLGLLLLLRKGVPSKALKILKLLGSLFLKLLDIIFAVFNLKIERLQNFQEATEI